MRSRLPAETVEFSVPCASEERLPFVCGKSENRPSGSLLLRTPTSPLGRPVTSTQLPLEKLSELLTQQ